MIDLKQMNMDQSATIYTVLRKHSHVCASKRPNRRDGR
jgi:hypothetical protein